MEEEKKECVDCETPEVVPAEETAEPLETAEDEESEVEEGEPETE